jgi:ABC-type bacteriocin/lantibiotic exporter with double-glycine peptidase domain
MKKSKLAQRKDGWCGPASLAYALRQQGVKIDQKKIAKETKTTLANGVNEKNLINYTKKLGLKAKVVANSKNPVQTLKKLHNEVKKGNSVIMDYLSGRHPTLDDGHYSVLNKVTKDKVKLWDPWMGRSKSVDKKNFIKNWKGESATSDAVMYREAIVIKK